MVASLDPNPDRFSIHRDQNTGH